MACVFDAKSQSALITSNPATLNHTCTGTNRLLVLSLIVKGAVERTGGSPTYAGVAMIQIGTPLKYPTSPESNVEMWYLPNPASGANTLSVPNAGGLSLRLIASSYTGAAQTDALDTYGDATGAIANPSKLITTTGNGEAIVDVMGHGLSTAETGRSHTLLYANDEGQWNDAAQLTIQANAGDITFSHTIAADDWALRVAAFKQWTTPPPQTISSAGNIDTGFAAGVAKIILTIAMAGAIATSEAHGSAKLNQNINPSGIVSAEVFGTSVFIYDQTLLPSGIESTEIFGTTQINQNLSPPGTASAEAFGTAQLNRIIIPSGIASIEVFGTAKTSLNILPAGVISEEIFGNATIIPDQFLSPLGIASAESFGTAQLNQNLSPPCIESAEVFGTPLVQATGGTQTISPLGLESAESFGTAQLNQNLSPPCIESAETLGLPIVQGAGQTQVISPSGIASTGIFGTTPLLKTILSFRIFLLPSQDYIQAQVYARRGIVSEIASTDYLLP